TRRQTPRTPAPTRIDPMRRAPAAVAAAHHLPRPPGDLYEKGGNRHARRIPIPHRRGAGRAPHTHRGGPTAAVAPGRRRHPPPAPPDRTTARAGRRGLSAAVPRRRFPLPLPPARQTRGARIGDGPAHLRPSHRTEVSPCHAHTAPRTPTPTTDRPSAPPAHHP